MRVLGIDPGLATMGYGIVEKRGGRLFPLGLGVIRTSSTDPTAVRLLQLQRELLDVIAAHSPEVVAMERLFFNANVKTAMSVGQAAGVALAAAAEAGLAAHDYTPPEVKVAVTGVGNAPKKQVQAMVSALLGLSQVPRFPDAADACALAICHLQRSGLRAAVGAAT